MSFILLTITLFLFVLIILGALRFSASSNDNEKFELSKSSNLIDSKPEFIKSFSEAKGKQDFMEAMANIGQASHKDYSFFITKSGFVFWNRKSSDYLWDCGLVNDSDFNEKLKNYKLTAIEDVSKEARDLAINCISQSFFWRPLKIISSSFSDQESSEDVAFESSEDLVANLSSMLYGADWHKGFPKIFTILEKCSSEECENFFCFEKYGYKFDNKELKTKLDKKWRFFSMLANEKQVSDLIKLVLKNGDTVSFDNHSYFNLVDDKIEIFSASRSKENSAFIKNLLNNANII